MMQPDQIRRFQLRQSIESECMGTIEQKLDRYLEVEHQNIIRDDYFSRSSSECILLYRDGYFIGAVMMSHAINEGIIKFIAEKNNIIQCKEAGNTKSLSELVEEFKGKSIITEDCAQAFMKIWGSFRADIHHMNPKIAHIPFEQLAQSNLKCLSTIEKEIFGYDIGNGAIIPRQPKYWDINPNGTTNAYLRLE